MTEVIGIVEETVRYFEFGGLQSFRVMDAIEQLLHVLKQDFNISSKVNVFQWCRDRFFGEKTAKANTILLAKAAAAIGMPSVTTTEEVQRDYSSTFETIRRSLPKAINPLPIEDVGSCLVPRRVDENNRRNKLCRQVDEQQSQQGGPKSSVRWIAKPAESAGNFTSTRELSNKIFLESCRVFMEKNLVYAPTILALLTSTYGTICWTQSVTQLHSAYRSRQPKWRS